MSFESLKQSRKNQFEHIANKFKESNVSSSGFKEDTRIWYPQGDKAGNGSAIIRFLPPTDTAPNGLPWVKVFNHRFKGPTGSWFVEPCPTTLGGECPVCEANRTLWNSGKESDKKIASERKRQVNYYSNVYIIKDPGNPENEGQVKIYRYGKKIFDMLNDMMNPSFDDIDRVNPFDLWEGANLRLRFKVEDSYRTYQASTFDTVKPLSTDEDKLKKIYELMFDLNEFVAPELFKGYDALSLKLVNVTKGKTPGLMMGSRSSQVEEEDVTASEPNVTEKVDDAVTAIDNAKLGDDLQEFEDFFKDE